MIETAVEAARAAGAILRERYRTRFAVRRKGPVDLVTEVDLRCEEAIREILGRRTPGTAVLGEEAGLSPGGRDRWIVDPLDGTVNYAHGYPCFCVSVAWEEAGTVTAGAVYDPLRDELFTATRGGGAFLGGDPVRVSVTERLDDALLATGFPYDRRTNPRNNYQAFVRLTHLTHGVRRGGSAALDLAYTACGRLDGFWEPGLKPWDVAAGALLVEEARGTVSGLGGQPFTPYGGDIAATNGKLHAELLRELGGVTGAGFVPPAPG